jgi:hypothetical protein
MTISIATTNAGRRAPGRPAGTLLEELAVPGTGGGER